MRVSLSKSETVLLVACMGVLALALFAPAVAQSTSYHGFADQRAFGGIPFAMDVLSNLPFALAARDERPFHLRAQRRAGFRPHAQAFGRRVGGGSRRRRSPGTLQAQAECRRFTRASAGPPNRTRLKFKE